MKNLTENLILCLTLGAMIITACQNKIKCTYKIPIEADQRSVEMYQEQKQESTIRPVDLKKIYGSVETQKFRIQSDRDTVIKGKDGIRIFIPGNSFESKEVIIDMQEFIKLSDIVSNNLMTISNGRLLRSKGMINIQAFNQKQEPIALKKGRSIEIVFPSSVMDDEEYQLFRGEKVAQNINWIPELSTSRPNTSLRIESSIQPFNKALVSKSIYTKIFSLHGLDTLKKHIDFKGTHGRRRIEGRVSIEIEVDEFGKLTHTRINQTPQNFDAASIVKALYKVDDWTPAIVGIQPYKTREILIFDIKLTPYTSSIKFPAQVRPIRKYRHLYKLAIELAKRYQDENREEYEAKYAFKDDFNEGSDKLISSKTNINAKGYILRSTRLGWINCDRFYRMKDELKQDIYVRLNDKTDRKVTLVLGGDVKALMNATSFEGDSLAIFKGVPKKGFKKLINTKKQGGKLLFAFNEVESSDANKMEINLSYAPTTFRKLRMELQSLDVN